MKIKVTITPTKTTSASLYLSGVYKARNGVMRILNENDDVIEWNKDIKDMPRGKGMYFTKNLPQLVIEYEDDENVSQKNGTQFQDKKNKAKHELFYANHVNLTLNGVRHANSVEFPSFNMEVSTVTLATQATFFQNTLKVKNRINSMSLEEKAAVADYYGVSPKNKTELDLLIELAGDKGICLTDKNMATFLREWMNPNEDTILVVNIRKAIRMNVIEERNTEGRIDYYIGTTLLGTRIEDLIGYCRNNPTIYTDHILRKVNEEKLDQEQAATERFAEKQSEEKPLTADEISSLRNEAGQLKKDGFIDRLKPVHNMKPENLLPVVEAARKLKKESLVEA